MYGTRVRTRIVRNGIDIHALGMLDCCSVAQMGGFFLCIPHHQTTSSLYLHHIQTTDQCQHVRVLCCTSGESDSG